MRPLQSSELILQPDGSIYHLALQPDQVASTIITVGDHERGARVSQHFDRIDTKVQKREFCTHTGEIGGKRLTVVSTGIGPDNIDIVFNELDALVNIDLRTRRVLDNHTQLTFIRIGTSGALQTDIDPGQTVVSEFAVVLDNLLHYYPDRPSDWPNELETAFGKAFPGLPNHYATMANPALVKQFSNLDHRGITLTCPGFYAPQGRSLRAQSLIRESFFTQLQSFTWKSHRITNLEMETAAIYGLAQLLGHRAVSLNMILANRPKGTFSDQPKKDVNAMIKNVLERVC